MNLLITPFLLLVALSATSQNTHVTHSRILNINQPSPCAELIDSNNGLFSVYPIPSSSQLTIDSKSLIRINEIKIINPHGQLIRSIIYYDSTTHITLNTSNMSEGLYMLKVLTASSESNYKILIKH